MKSLSNELVKNVREPAFLATLAEKLTVAVLPLYIKDGLRGDDAEPRGEEGVVFKRRAGSPW